MLTLLCQGGRVLEMGLRLFTWFYKKPTFGTFLHKTFLKLSYKNFLKISGVWN